MFGREQRRTPMWRSTPASILDNRRHAAGCRRITRVRRWLVIRRPDAALHVGPDKSWLRAPTRGPARYAHD